MAGFVITRSTMSPISGHPLTPTSTLCSRATTTCCRRFSNTPPRSNLSMPRPLWLDQVRKHDEQAGQRTLDVLDVHYYPQASGVFSAADDPQTRGLRLRSTRALWDPTYTDESWIGEPVRLIPRLREWVDRYYPGT